MNITVKSRHMEATDALRDYVEGKVAKLPKYYDNIQNIEVILDKDSGESSVEILVSATRKQTFVAHSRGQDMYACVDQCLDKVSQQVRRHKDKVRDRQGPSHEETMQ